MMEDCIELASNKSDTENPDENVSQTQSEHKNPTKSENIKNPTEIVPNTPLIEPISEKDKKWEKLVIYYLARLKGLCDWRKSNDTVLQKPTKYVKRCTSGDIESRIIEKIMPKPFIRCTDITNSNEINDIGIYMAAGYEEGKEQAIKIILRSLKYGVLTGILTRRGNCYRIASEYLSANRQISASPERKKNTGKNKKENEKPLPREKCSVKSLKRNVKNKRIYKDKKKRDKRSETLRKSNNPRGMKRKILSKQSSIINKKRSKQAKSSYYSLKRTCNDGNISETSNPAPLIRRTKRQSDTNVNLSASTYQSLSRSLTPLEERNKKKDVKAKRPRPKIKKQVYYVPPMKKPRTQSQSKSPSHHTDDDEVRDKLRNNKTKPNKRINTFEMPRQRRYLDMSSISTTTSRSTITLCAFCKETEQKNKKTHRKQ